MAERIDWNSFVSRIGDEVSNPMTHLGGAPSAEDEIFLEEEPGAVDPNVVEIVLATAASITWWKGIRIWVRDGGEGGVDTVNAYHGPAFLRVAVGLLAGGRLELQKAKVLGVHTGMYELSLDAIADRGGTRFSFTWIRD